MARTHGPGCHCDGYRTAKRPPPKPWRRPDWYDQAACRGMDPDLFFPGRGDIDAVNQAKAVCAGCDVRALCAAAGRNEKYGIWGAQSERQRRQIRRTA